MIEPNCEPFPSSDVFFSWVARRLNDAGRLTPTEQAICEQLILGRQYQDIALLRNISLETVRWHVKHILKKLDAESSREFILVIGRDIDERLAQALASPGY